MKIERDYQLELGTINLCAVKFVPLEAVKIMSGFSEEVAIAVTQPLWPDKDPRSRNWSAIVD